MDDCQRGEHAVMKWILYGLAGAASGILSGMGIGGGVLLIPALVIFGGVAQHSAQGVNLLYFLPTAAAALWIHRKSGQLEKRVLPMLIIGGVLGALAGGYVANILEADVLRKLFGGFVIVMGILEIRKGFKHEQS
ncbi:MAG: sulfite exporter TauE/SafE family protein [Firmicutes bacterium]|nr:sulfite exporter TauE/SafE family protein [Bacillota bacterium]